MKRSLSIALALLMPGTVFAQSALEEIGADKAAVSKVKADLSGKADAQHLFVVVEDTHTKTTSLEIREQQLEHPYLLNVSVDHGSESILPATALDRGFIILFHWNGSKIEVVRKDQFFQAAPGTPEAKAIERSISDPILAEIPMESSDSVKGTIRFKADDLFLADLANLAGPLQKSGANTGLGIIDRANSRVLSLESYPANVEAQARVMIDRNPDVQTNLGSDPRMYALELHYSLSEIRGDKDYEQRAADGRVGYFTQSRLDYSNQHLKDRGIPIETVIERWNLQKTDPNAAVSDVKNPIVYWLDETIPTEYRPALKAGIWRGTRPSRPSGFETPSWSRTSRRT